MQAVVPEPALMPAQWQFGSMDPLELMQPETVRLFSRAKGTMPQSTAA